MLFRSPVLLGPIGTQDNWGAADGLLFPVTPNILLTVPKPDNTPLDDGVSDGYYLKGYDVEFTDYEMKVWEFANVPSLYAVMAQASPPLASPPPATEFKTFRYRPTGALAGITPRTNGGGYFQFDTYESVPLWSWKTYGQACAPEINWPVSGFDPKGGPTEFTCVETGLSMNSPCQTLQIPPTSWINTLPDTFSTNGIGSWYVRVAINLRSVYVTRTGGAETLTLSAPLATEIAYMPWRTEPPAPSQTGQVEVANHYYSDHPEYGAVLGEGAYDISGQWLHNYLSSTVITDVIVPPNLVSWGTIPNTNGYTVRQAWSGGSAGVAAWVDYRAAAGFDIGGVPQHYDIAGPVEVPQSAILGGPYQSHYIITEALGHNSLALPAWGEAIEYSNQSFFDRPALIIEDDGFPYTARTYHLYGVNGSPDPNATSLLGANGPSGVIYVYSNIAAFQGGGTAPYDCPVRLGYDVDPAEVPSLIIPVPTIYPGGDVAAISNWVYYYVPPALFPVQTPTVDTCAALDGFPIITVPPKPVVAISPANLSAPAEHYWQAIATPGGIHVVRSDSPVPMLHAGIKADGSAGSSLWDTAPVLATAHPADTSPSLAVLPSGRLFLAFCRPGAGVYLCESPGDDGQTWKAEILMIPSATHPALTQSTDGALLLLAAVASGSNFHVQGVYRASGDPSFSSVFTVVDASGAPLLVQNDSFGITHTHDKASRWVLHILIASESTSSAWFSADEGRSFTRIAS